MAVKDHTLDSKIIDAAKAEFMEHGYAKASLHKIAARAGITTGALYTRYKNKDDLFISLTVPGLAAFTDQVAPLQEKYMEVMKYADAEKFLAAVQEEMKVCLEVLFDHYEECVLFFCKSGGSSLEVALKKMMEEKARQTICFLKEIARKDMEFDGVEMILMEQFSFFKLILEKGYTKEKTIACLKVYEDFTAAGWKDLFEKIL